MRIFVQWLNYALIFKMGEDVLSKRMKRTISKKGRKSE